MSAAKKNPHHSSESNDHGSPPAILEAARRTMGSIDLDPASSPVFNRNVRARRIYTIEQNGLAQAWGGGNVWLNPPGGVDPKTRESRQATWWWALAKRWSNRTVVQGLFLGFSIELLQVAQDDEDIPPEFRNPSPLHFPFCIPRSRPRYHKQVEVSPGEVKLVEQTAPTHAGVVVYLPPLHGFDEWQARFVRDFSPIGEVANLRTPATIGRSIA